MFRLLAVSCLGWAIVAGFAWSHLKVVSSACAAAEYEFAASSACRFDTPQDLTLSPDGKDLYLADVNGNWVAVLDAETLAFKGTIGAGLLAWPHDVSVGPDGRLYVADTGNRRVAIFSIRDGAAAFAGELKADFIRPEGVLAHPNGRVYVADDDGGKIVAFRDGERVAEVAGLSGPHDVEADGDGLIVVEAGTHRLRRLSADLKPEGEIVTDRPFEGPRYLAVAEDGTLAVAEKVGNRVTLVSPSGARAGEIGSGSAGLGPDLLSAPEGVVFSGDRLYVTDSGNGRVVKYVRHAATAAAPLQSEAGK